MAKKNKVFNAICSIWVTCFIILASAPLITLALPTTQLIPLAEEPSTQAQQSLPENQLVTPTLTNNEPEFDSYTYLERQEENLPTILPTETKYYGSKVVYLTFDDGPDSVNTPHVLAILKEHGVKATFFVLGTEVEKNPAILQQIYEEGHGIGNHSYNHIYRELYHSASTYTQQLHRNDEVIKNVLGVRPHISRAPGGSAGSFTTEYWDALHNQGYIEVGWNISSGDASNANADTIFNNIAYQTEKNKFLWSHAILLMHDSRGHEETVKALPQIITFYKNQGFEFGIINSKTPPAW